MKVSVRLQPWFEAFDSRSPRERALVLVTLLALLLFAWNSLVSNPLSRKRRVTQNEITRVDSEILQLRAEKVEVEQRAKIDPDLTLRRQIEELRLAIAGLDHQLEERMIDLMSPQQMPELLQQMLKKQHGLKLVSLENLPPQKLLEPIEGQDPPPELYRHALVMQMEGNYLNLLAYLKALEEMPHKVFWDILAVEVQDYPLMKVRLQLHTLSLSEDLIGV